MTAGIYWLGLIALTVVAYWALAKAWAWQCRRTGGWRGQR